MGEVCSKPIDSTEINPLHKEAEYVPVGGMKPS